MGIALADILANGVSIIMLLIVITISSKYQMEQREIEKVDEVTRVLSRDIASSVVMNNLAASPPAVLHDYVNSPNDRDLRHAVMPIIELHRNNIRDYYSGRVWERQQLLYQDNDFDNYLDSLDQNQRLRVRTDVYEIDMFYIYMSILREHEIDPKHWHFSVAGEAGPGNRLAMTGNSSNWAKLFGTAEEHGEFAGAGGEEDWASEQQAIGIAGTGDSLSDSDYPWDELGAQNQPGGANPSADNKMRFRLASPDGPLQSQMSMQLPEYSGQNLLEAALSYLKIIDRELQQGRAVTGKLDNMIEYLQQFMRFPLKLTDYEQQAVKQIKQQLQHQFIIPPVGQVDYLNIDHEQRGDFRGLGAEFEVNRPVDSVKIISNAGQGEYLDALPAHGSVHFHLQHYPELFQGLSLPVARHSVLLAPEYAPSDKWRWYPVFFIYPEFDDFVMGFVYATVSEAGRIILAAESNQLAVEGYSLTMDRSEERNDSEHLLAAIFGIALLILLIIYGLLLPSSSPAPLTAKN